ncbi:response regulator [Vibrio tapetis]|uniref:Transcriptional regulatory protein n=1 Tax=Vibrio tapetis subsp. tapetis TaxID=1671868 RepID=A0A2N8ZIT5_9VIBR|nr:response regulator [Vibrio tapetis]SON51786.1 DNA-binding response regulator in two-component regulatory system with citA [Vibrio tapetis subsp. tapetis]
MNTIDVLIIEDEVGIAELHAQFLRQTVRFNPIGIASTIAMAKTMIRVNKPRLILLDNYLPDGRGIELLREIVADKSGNQPDVILVTASSEMDTVKDALQCGCFDYLLKPVSYDRLQETLNRYLKYNSAINAFDNISQRHVDDLFNMQARDKVSSRLPKGIGELTLDKIKQVFSENCGIKFTAESLGSEVGISKTTARRYLEFCSASGFLTVENEHGRVGRPERVYVKNA